MFDIEILRYYINNIIKLFIALPADIPVRVLPDCCLSAPQNITERWHQVCMAHWGSTVAPLLITGATSWNIRAGLTVGQQSQ